MSSDSAICEPLTVSCEVAAKMLGIGRSLAYQEARAGRLPGVIRIGTRFVVSRKRLLDFINGEGSTEMKGVRANEERHRYT